MRGFRKHTKERDGNDVANSVTNEVRLVGAAHEPFNNIMKDLRIEIPDNLNNEDLENLEFIKFSCRNKE